jgi:hypothetical protein
MSVHAHGLNSGYPTASQVASRIVGLHNTTQHTPHLSVRARVPGFERSHLEDLMYDEWKLVRFRAMRLTMFVFPLDLLEIAAAATRNLTAGMAERWFRDSQLTRSEFDRTAALVEEALATRPMTVRDLRKELSVAPSVDLPGIVGRLCDVGRLVGGAPPASWRSSVRRYHRWIDVLPQVDLHRWDEAAAQRELIRRYIDSYGPVTLSDISWWTGLTKKLCREALEGIEVEEISVDGWPGPLLATEVAPCDDEAVVRALPILDPYAQGYRDRHRLVDPALDEHVWDWGGNATPTVVLGGRVIGVWQTVVKPEPTVLYHLFGDEPRQVVKAAEHDLAAAGRMYFDREVNVTRIPEMTSLNAPGRRRSAAHPLDGRLHRAPRQRS